VLDLLKPECNAKDQQIAADPRRIILVLAPPFTAQLVKACIGLNELRSS